MLFVLFSAGDDRFAISSRQVEEILPLAQLKSLPHSHPAFAGLLNYHGTPIPILDFNVLLGLPPVEPCFVSRIMLCNATFGNRPPRLLGLLAQKVTETRNLPEFKFIDPGARPSDAGYLGKIYEETDGRFLQWIHPEKILPQAVLEELGITTMSAK